MKKVFLIDTLALAYKTYFAFMSRPLVNSKGQNVGAIYGFLSILLKLIEKQRPDYIAAAFDSKEKTFRHELYPLYKSNREIMPEELIFQVEKIKEILKLMNISVLVLPGFEADDLVGTMAEKLKSNDLIIYLLSPDKDYIQLIDDKTFVFKPSKKSYDEIEIIDRLKAESIYEIPLKYFLEYFALTGDSSDFIPGVKGIGKVIAAELINQFGTLENIYLNINSITKKSTKEYLINQKDMAFLSRDLVTIKRDIPLNYQIEDLKFQEFNISELKKILNELEIRAFTKRIDELFQQELSLFSSSEIEPEKIKNDVIKTEISFDENNVDYKLINNFDELCQLVKKLENVDKIVFDTETDSLIFHKSNLIGISLSFEEKQAFFISFRNLSEQDKKSYILELEKIFLNEKILKIGQNLKFDLNVLRKHNIRICGKFFDTMVASYILNPDSPHSMDEMAKKMLNYDTIKISELIGEKKDATLMNIIDIEKISNYSCEDADITFRLYSVLEKELQEKNLLTLCLEIEFPLINVLAKMEYEGVFIDKEELNILSKDLDKELFNIEKAIYEFAGRNFNINSPKQLQEILFDELKLQPLKKTKTGVSTDVQTLEQLKYDHPIINKLIDYRKLSKLKSTYIDALPKLINPVTDRIHSSYNQAVTSTGRLSSSNPNLQNIPIHGELGKEIRKAFIPQHKHWKIMSSDYSQIELRLMAAMSKDEKMLEAFKNKIDIHSKTAALVYNCSIDKINSDMRRKAKEVNFGILYGIGAHGLKVRLGITHNQAKEIIDNYFKSFPEIKNYLNETVKFAQKNGYVETLKKRRRYLPNINSKNFTVKSFEERAAINMPIQGTASDLIKIAMININKRFEEESINSKLIMQVHDELVFEVDENEIELVKKIVKEEMESAIELQVPIEVEIGIGDSWLEAH